ncbi:hypothetical protein TSAR_005828 [Trichomalopsis sarcophagae]|uniref:Uncharacterized protein n=1 Tax=Trichomalopsis sarcophagae TaxID=543379 RepID=A0A232F506_9HYME|nr:hypothetical protein TSAR_005828 [Trichomalopsis sarcophagae]
MYTHTEPTTHTQTERELPRCTGASERAAVPIQRAALSKSFLSPAGSLVLRSARPTRRKNVAALEGHHQPNLQDESKREEAGVGPEEHPSQRGMRPRL